ncbi:hypothetical protein [Argonema galeatum]|uniref:hypothetical protein n=1 Tax=Argonema galeatum TaxID=2942762 RepID=UPI002011348C|nr:hypothetical protein [Argonema galeatum]MCL1464982.1 hypothetical protein [Argonema galeatum A003/A1]
MIRKTIILFGAIAVLLSLPNRVKADDIEVEAGNVRARISEDGDIELDTGRNRTTIRSNSSSIQINTDRNWDDVRDRSTQNISDETYCSRSTQIQSTQIDIAEDNVVRNSSSVFTSNCW